MAASSRILWIAFSVSVPLHLVTLLIPTAEDDVPTGLRYHLNQVPSSWMAISRARRPELASDGMVQLPGLSFPLPSSSSESSLPTIDLPVTAEPEVATTDSLLLVARYEKEEWRPPVSDANNCRNGIDDDGDGQTDCGDADCASEQFCETGSAYR